MDILFQIQTLERRYERRFARMMKACDRMRAYTDRRPWRWRNAARLKKRIDHIGRDAQRLTDAIDRLRNRLPNTIQLPGDIDELLRFNVIAAARDWLKAYNAAAAPGKRLDESLAMSLSAPISKALARARADALTAAGDTTLDDNIDHYLAAVADLGFERVLEDSFEHRDIAERLFVLAHRDGLLMILTTWGGAGLNSSHLYYNWRTHDSAAPAPSTPRIVHYGQWHDEGSPDAHFAGYTECREGLRHKLTHLRADGRFLLPWATRPWFSLMTFADERAEPLDVRAITAARINRLPDWVKTMIDAPCELDRAA